MKNNKTLLFAAAILFLGVTAFTLRAKEDKTTKNDQANDLAWLTDATKAGELSKETGKPVFAFFTGSDWCGWCMKLQRDVFAKQEFKTWAEDNVVLLELDFPRRKKLPPALAQQNNELRNLFRVSGYPTIWMFTLAPADSTDKLQIQALGSLGYPSGAEKGKEQVKFLKTANSILAKAAVKP